MELATEGAKKDKAVDEDTAGSAGAAQVARSAADAHPADGTAVAALEETTDKLASLSVEDAQGAQRLPGETRRTGGLRALQQNGTRFEMGGGVSFTLLPNTGLRPAEGARGQLPDYELFLDDVEHTWACQRGGGLGKEYVEVYGEMSARALEMAKRLDSMSETARDALWGSGGPNGCSEQRPTVMEREGDPQDCPFVGERRFGRERIRSDYQGWVDTEAGAAEADYVLRWTCREWRLRELRRDICNALVFEAATEAKRMYLESAPTSASVRRARRGLDQQGPEQGVVPQYVAAHLLGIESASDAGSLRATGLEHDPDGSGTASTYPPSSAEGSGSTGFDETHRSGHVFPNYAVPLAEQFAEPVAIQQRTYDHVDEESSEDDEREEDWGGDELELYGEYDDDDDYGD
jgi:hypothetical protein